MAVSEHFLDQADSELVFGLVAAVGTNLEEVRVQLEDRLGAMGYDLRVLRLSESLKTLADIDVADGPEHDRIRSHMNAGNRVREMSGRDDFLALHAVIEAGKSRIDGGGGRKPKAKTAWLVWSLKRPEEVETLRKVYGEAFFLIGVFSHEQARKDYLVGKDMDEATATDLMDADQKEDHNAHGQRTSKTFHLADCFVDINAATFKKDVKRFVDLVFGSPFETPRLDEYAMFLAYGAALRSADLSRQVGAVACSEMGDVVAVGANDVPRAGGGLYWPGDDDRRDHAEGEDSNEVEREILISDVLSRLKHLFQEDVSADQARKTLDGCRILDITEYGRPVHAEMEAILSAGRNGVSLVDGALYVTTFPCHNCAKHIVAAGLLRVVYIEPYPKSQAEKLHGDAIAFAGKGSEECGSVEPRLRGGPAPVGKITFEPFVGVGPRRFLDLFSMTMGSGRELRRKKKGGAKDDWGPGTAVVRVPLSPLSYLEREQAVAPLYDELTKGGPEDKVDAEEEQERREER